MSAPARKTTGAPQVHVRLGDVDPDFLGFVEEGERRQAGELTLPAIDLADGLFDPVAILRRPADSYAMVISGMVNRQIRLGDQAALRVLGPGAVLLLFDTPSPNLISRSEWNAAGKVRLAVLGEEFSRACARWPQLQRNFFARFAEQLDHLAAQLALCQLPRVEDRLLAMLWLLAESWGKVTSAGTMLPLHFTHEALGAMVGARRPTVTLALGELVQSGAIVQSDGGWLLLQSPPQPSGEGGRIESPRRIELEPTAWAATDLPSMDRARAQRQDLLALINRLREEHQRSISQLQERLDRAQAIRERAYEIRDRMRDRRQTDVSPQRAGSHR